MIFSIGFRPFPSRLATAVLGIVLAGAASPAQTPSHEPEFLAENQAAMAKMMTAMDVPPAGDVDLDFVATMVPHHQGAIDMALAELRYGRNEHLRRVAEEIVVEQQQEIAVMRLAVHRLPSLSGSTITPPSVPSARIPTGAVMPGMNMAPEK